MSESKLTSDKHPRLKNLGDKAGSRNFNKKGQPAPEAKKAGWLRKKKGQELARAILELSFKGAKNSELRKQMAEYYGITEAEITVEMMGLFRQAEKMIGKADTPAFKAVMERAHGAPQQQIEVTGDIIRVKFEEENGDNISPAPKDNQ